MKLALNICFFLIALFSFGDQSFSLTDYQIKKICKKVKRESSLYKKFNLQKGNLIEIPVVPYKR